MLVAEGDGGVLGWASLNVFNARRAYEHVADLSLYVERDARGRGVGRQLLEALVARASELGYHKLVLAAFPWNEAGMRAYRARDSARWGSTGSRGAWTGAGSTRSSWRRSSRARAPTDALASDRPRRAAVVGTMPEVKA